MKSRVKQPVTYADVWEFWLRNPSLADEVDFITVHLLPYWEDEPIGLERREADGQLRIEKHLLDIYRKVQQRFPGKKIVIGETGWPSDGRMRSDARPGRVEQVTYFSIFRTIAEREKFDYNVVEAFDQYWKARQEGTVGAAWGLLDAYRNDKFELGKPVVAEPHWRILFALSTILSGLLLIAFFSWRRRAPAKPIAIFAVFCQLVATCYVQSVWLDMSRTFYFERMLGVVFWAILLGAFGYALLRGIADSLTGRMADPSLYGARVREAWHAWRELPRFRVLQRADLLLQMLYLVLTVLCIFYLVVITIDWYDGVIRFSDTFFRQIAIDGRYRDFPIWSFVLPSIVLMAWKVLTVLRKEKVSRPERLMRALSFGRLLGYDGSRGFVRMDRSFSRVRPVLPEILLSALLIVWAAAMLLTEGAIKLYDGGCRRLRGGRWWPLGNQDTFLEHPGRLVRRHRRADGGPLSRDHLRVDPRTTGRTATGLLYQQMVASRPGVTGHGNQGRVQDRGTARQGVCGVERPGRAAGLHSRLRIAREALRYRDDGQGAAAHRAGERGLQRQGDLVRHRPAKRLQDQR